MVREGLVRMLAEDSEIGEISEAENGLQALEMARVARPDVVVMDFDMPHYNGVYGTRELIRRRSGAKVIMLSMHHSRDSIIEAIQAGVKGFVMKEAPSEELLAAIKEVHKGYTWFKGQVAEIIAPYLISVATGKSVEKPKNVLTAREKEVTRLYAEGMSAREVSQKLKLSKRTIEVHKANIFKKLDIHNTAELVRYAVKNNLVKIP